MLIVIKCYSIVTSNALAQFNMNIEKITISDNAASRIQEITSKGDEKGKKLRISVDSGGCSGFQYRYDFIDQEKSEDIIFEKNNVAVVIDPISIEFIKGSEVDYVETLGFSSFEIKNPNSGSRCGCGNSFSI